MIGSSVETSVLPICLAMKQGAVFIRRALAITLSGYAAGWSEPAFAFRPFDGTDAAVAALGELELELGPTGVRRDGSERTLVAPAMAFNLGLAVDWEAVLQGQGETALSPAS